eukprot:TRINITY_DN713_c0_g1_i1.p1 TRINITY_DN713_c0_g1~~TRINITY_DN713_c0_g1_i1.p1  ORF type:complete len:103 (-),score=7.20 TRINITY_DN713_c0_g1_i1:177-485(-)
MAYAEDEPENEKKGIYFRGSDLTKVPCLRESLMYSIGSGLVAGLAYNLATSRLPYRMAFGTYTVVLFGYFGFCRYQYRKREHNMRVFKTALNQRMVTGRDDA